MEKSQFIEAGKIVNTHGIHGEVKAEIWLDSLRFFKKFDRIFIGLHEYKLEWVKEQKSFAILKLEKVDDINSAVVLKEKVFSVAREDARLPKGKFFLSDIIGAGVINENGKNIGVLKEIIENPAQLVYVVEGEEEHLIPAVSEFILSTDVENGIITVHLIEGM